ncbi:beta-galactosidase [Paenibacillus mesotrionivorans]|uniref:Beta-galactosidase n=1 Tax=Paenibacillus mesotrionivorans TaxID=3160968 RepID=A0ACC7P4F4_9BACL
MDKKHDLLRFKPAVLLHGADYNPEQWLDEPEVLQEDIRLMCQASCNVMAVGIFAWAALEREEGVFTFGWLDETLDRLAAGGLKVWLATPSGARPPWLAAHYPEVMRVGPDRVRRLFGIRHNHCYTSPVYRQKVTEINGRLAERYARHPAVLGWHVSNEYGGECHCTLCQDEFRLWLQNRYGSLDALNKAWWTAFWSRTYTDWHQIESPAPHGEHILHGMNLDWRRFVTDRTVDFCLHEMAPLRRANPELPVTTNMMGLYDGLDYRRFVPHLDVLSWDSYPAWHEKMDDSEAALAVSFQHDLFRSMKGRPFVLMESTPSTTNWQPASKLKRPGLHRLSSLQAVAHGADAVQYFQWRKSRGASEKFHGAVVDHAGREDTRVFREVAELGAALKRLAAVTGSGTEAKAAILFDWDNKWAVENAQGPRNGGLHYEETLYAHYRPFWQHGVAVDVAGAGSDFSAYRLVVAPMIYLCREETAAKLERFVESGGILVVTYWSGIVGESDLCHTGGFPGPLRRLLGIWAEEIDGLQDGETNRISLLDGNGLGLSGEYACSELCERIHPEGAETLAVYKEDFYAGMPALTVNLRGQGKAYYLAARMEAAFHEAFYASLINNAGLRRATGTRLPDGVTAQIRVNGPEEYVFLLNFNKEQLQVMLAGPACRDAETGMAVEEGTLWLDGYGARVLSRARCL